MSTIPCPNCGGIQYTSSEWCKECNGTGEVPDQRTVRRSKLIKLAETLLDQLEQWDQLSEWTDNGISTLHDLAVIAVSMRLGKFDENEGFKRDE